MTMVDVVS